jgi:hypothetical protein
MATRGELVASKMKNTVFPKRGKRVTKTKKSPPRRTIINSNNAAELFKNNTSIKQQIREKYKPLFDEEDDKEITSRNLRFRLFDNPQFAQSHLHRDMDYYRQLADDNWNLQRVKRLMDISNSNSQYKDILSAYVSFLNWKNKGIFSVKINDDEHAHIFAVMLFKRLDKLNFSIEQRRYIMEYIFSKAFSSSYGIKSRNTTKKTRKTRKTKKKKLPKPKFAFI